MFYNKLLIGKDNSFNSAFNTFKSNADADSSVTNDNTILDANFQHLPTDFLDADLTMVAGAYGSGKICAYDNIGNIIDLGFSRTGSAYGIVDDFVLYGEDTPVLDSYVRSLSTGYLIENALSNITNNSRQLVNVTGSGVEYSFSNPRRYTVSSLSDPRVQNIGNQTFTSPSYSSRGRVMMIVKPNSEHGINRSCSLGYEGYMRGVINGLNLDGSYSSVFQMLDLKITPVKGYLLVEWITDSVRPPDTSYSSTRARFFPSSPTDWSTTNAEIGDFGYLLAVNGTIHDSSITTLDNTPRKILPPRSGSIGIAGADIIAPIALTSSAKVFIKTVKTSKLLTLPSGTFNIHDYISNDKLICFTIKYI